MGNPILYIVIPCYNEEAVLPLTSGMFLKKIKDLAAAGKISDKSRILFVNDGSKDKTWDIIRSLAEADEHYRGVCLSRNRGHQNALLAGLMTAKDLADVTISIDCDGQDDINAMDAMIDEYLAGMDVVYGVRSKRETDTWFKRTTAEGFYKVMKALGADVVFNHADYRLLSKRALEGLAEFREVNLFLRGLVPLVGYRCSSVYYERAERIAGESHYPLKKMLAFAFDGITSLSVKPLRLITLAGMLVSALFSSLVALLKFMADPFEKLPQIVFWLMGSFSGSSQEKVLYILPVYVIAFVLIWLYRWKINVMSMGDQEAASYGVNVKTDRLVVILAASVLTSMVVSISGIISWVGIVVPHLARMIVGPDFRKICPVSVSLGICYLLLIDGFCRAVSTAEIPIGVVTGIIGAPLFMYFIMKKKVDW